MHSQITSQSTYSLCRGTMSVEVLVRQAALFGIPALALTDRDNIYGLIPFIQACRDWGVRPIAGAEVTGPEGRVILLVRTQSGYAHLCRILTQRRLNPEFGLVEALRDWSDGLAVLASAPHLLQRLSAVVPRSRLWGSLEGWNCGPLAETCRSLGLSYAAANPTVMLSRADLGLQATLAAVRENTMAGRLSAKDCAHPEAVFKSPAALKSLYRRCPEALKNADRIADQCRYVPRRERWILPSLPLPGGELPQAHLRRRCLEGMDRRFGKRPVAALRRLDVELGVIHELGFTDYFVIVGDIVRFARSQGIATVGRGSGAGALTAYLLGITNVDPLHYGLYFERFLHRKRPDCPDLDIDLCWKRRDDVINYVYETYGHERVAMISTHTTFQVRSAFREAARAHGVPVPVVNKFSRRLPRQGGSIRAAIKGLGLPSGRAPWPRVLRDAERMLAMPRHLGVHPGGLVIGDRPLDHYVPLEHASKGIVVTQFEMRAIEAVGLVKMDLLGNRALSTIQETVELVSARHGVDLEPDRFPDPDPKAAALMTAGDTLGVFQMESPGMRNLNRMLRTKDLTTTIAAVALIRPGPAGSGMKERYVRRARGLEPVTCFNSKLLPVLRETLGVPLYEEDVMRMAAAVAGVSLEDGDMIRRAIAEGRSEEVDELGRMFQRAAWRRGYQKSEAESIWRHLMQFGAFAFCKAHAAGYGVLAYQTAWLKAHYLTEFSCALMNHHSGMYDKRTHLQDIQRRGVHVLGPCVNRSQQTTAPERCAMRIGLEYVRGLSLGTIERLVQERRRREFAGVEDFIRRVAVKRPELETLIIAGAFDFTRRTRPELLCAAASGFERFTRGRRMSSEADDLFSEAPRPLDVPPLPQFSRTERLWMEWYATGLCIGGHPMEAVPGRRDLMQAREAERQPGKTVRVGGIVAARRIVPTKNDESMQFVTLEDESGMIECTLFPAIHNLHGRSVRGLGPYVAEGRIEDQYGAPTLTVDRIQRLPLPAVVEKVRRRVGKDVDVMSG